MSRFTDLYLRRVFRTIEKNKLVENGDRIFVGLSGGKDSASCLYVLKRFVEERGVDCEIKGFYINLDDSPEIMESIKGQAEMSDVELVTIEPPDISRYRGPRPICSVCGIAKRYLMNRVPREKGANKVATGHNMDDFIVFFLKNLVGKNYSWISNFRARVDSTHPRLLTRIRPLFNVGNKENSRFCKEMNIPFTERHICRFKAKECDYNRRRANWYKILYDIEKWNRNFRQQMISAINDISPLFMKDEKLRTCSVCGEPTSGDVCAYCRIFGNRGSNSGHTPDSGKKDSTVGD